MKIALLSFHNAANYGAALQAYALQHYLDNLGYESEYIDYQNEMRRSAYDMNFHIRHCIKRHQWLAAIKYLAGAPFMQSRKSKFGLFYQKLHCTEKTYYNNQQLEEIADNYDKYVVGSDQVWNPHHNGRDTAFLLSFVKNDQKKISYSSSFGIVDVPIDLLMGYKRYLASFAHLSCREKMGCQLIKELTGRDATHVLDPVFLLERKEWSELINKRNRENYVFCYTNRENQLVDFFNTTKYQLNGSKLYKLTRYIKPSDFISPSVKVKYTMSPEDFLGSIRDSKLVITASFHCLALAIIFNRQFVCFTTGDKGKDERIVGLLESLGLVDRIYTPTMTLEDVNKPIDYDMVNSRIEKLVRHSSEYLKNALNS